MKCIQFERTDKIIHIVTVPNICRRAVGVGTGSRVHTRSCQCSHARLQRSRQLAAGGRVLRFNVLNTLLVSKSLTQEHSTWTTFEIQILILGRSLQTMRMIVVALCHRLEGQYVVTFALYTGTYVFFVTLQAQGLR